MERSFLHSRRAVLLLITVLPYLLYGTSLLIWYYTRSGAETSLNLVVLASIYAAFGILFLALVYQAVAVFARLHATRFDRIMLAVMSLALCPFLAVLLTR
jgi:hypothetical protein